MQLSSIWAITYNVTENNDSLTGDRVLFTGRPADYNAVFHTSDGFPKSILRFGKSHHPQLHFFQICITIWKIASCSAILLPNSYYDSESPYRFRHPFPGMYNKPENMPFITSVFPNSYHLLEKSICNCLIISKSIIIVRWSVTWPGKFPTVAVCWAVHFYPNGPSVASSGKFLRFCCLAERYIFTQTARRYPVWVRATGKK